MLAVSYPASAVALDRAARETAGLDTVGSKEADGVVRADRLVLDSRVTVDGIGPVFTELTVHSELGPVGRESLMILNCLQILSNLAFSLP